MPSTNFHLNGARERGRRAFSLLEAVVAMAILVLFLAGLFDASMEVIRMIARHKETVAASQSIQERIEQLRSLSYTGIIDPNYIYSNVLNTATISSAQLPALVESVTVSGFPSGGSFQEQWPETGSPAAPPSPSLASSSAVLVDLQLTWQTAGGQQRMREVQTIVANGGIGR